MYLGIDLGTSNSAVVGHSDEGLRLFKTEDGRDVLPSVLHYDRRGRMAVGVKAQAQAELTPENAAQGFKRLMGTSSTIELKGAGLTLLPEDASAEIIRQLLRQVELEIGATAVTGAVVTIPAAFNQMQSEATIRAAHAAGLERVGLLQEPIAAAMASLEGASQRDGRFLVYDLGGGTLDVALVEASGGAVNVIAHEGINMLGGRDFDRMIVDSVIRPWLQATFSLPADATVRPEYRRLFTLARMKAETAKVELSTREETHIFLAEEEARTDDQTGEPIYVDVRLERAKLEQLIRDKISDSVALCRKVLNDNSLNHEDIDRVVFIGGPSKMPLVREMVSRELGIAADHRTDPMTAVARGAAIFAESRVWDDAAGQRKSEVGRASASGQVEVSLRFTARSSEETATIRLITDAPERRLRRRVRDAQGGSDGFAEFIGTDTFEVAIAEPGQHRFWIDVCDDNGAQVCPAQEITIVRTAASAAAIPATQTVSVKVARGRASERTNTLSVLVKKGTPLPASGMDTFSLREGLVSGDPAFFEAELFNQADGVDDPLLNLFIGAIRIHGTDLNPGQRLPAGSTVELHWNMDDNGLFKCAIAVPDLGLSWNHHNFYASTIGHSAFTGEEGQRLALDKLSDAASAVDDARSALDGAAAFDLDQLERRIARQRDLLSYSQDSEVRRAVTEEALLIRQELSRLENSDGHRHAALSHEIESLSEATADHVDALDPQIVERVSGLLHTAREQMGISNWSSARQALDQAANVFYRELAQQPSFLAAMFSDLENERHLALDKSRHDQLVVQGRTALQSGNIDALRGTIGDILGNRMPNDTRSKGVTALASLLK